MSIKKRNQHNEKRRLNNSNYWKQLNEFPAYYINCYGTVYSTYLHRELKASPDAEGYRAVTLYNSSGSKRRTIHTLVLEHFHGPKPTDTGQYIVGRHLDSNPLNNHYTNLCWSTQADNLNDRNENGTAVRGDSHPRSRLSSVDIPVIRALAASGHPATRIAQAFGVANTTIANVITGSSWAHVTSPPPSAVPQPLNKSDDTQQVITNAVETQLLTTRQLAKLYGLPTSAIRCTPNVEASGVV